MDNKKMNKRKQMINKVLSFILQYNSKVKEQDKIKVEKVGIVGDKIFLKLNTSKETQVGIIPAIKKKLKAPGLSNHYWIEFTTPVV